MDLDEAFSEADSLLAKAEEEGAAAMASVDAAMTAVTDALASGTIVLSLGSAAKTATALEDVWLTRLAGLREEVDRATAVARSYYEIQQVSAEDADAPARPSGFIGRLLGRRVAPSGPASPEQHPLAQKAYAGRYERLSRAAAAVAQAASFLPARRVQLDEAVFAVQERAVAAARNAGSEGLTPEGRRDVYALEEIATVLAAHSDRAALHQRSLSASGDATLPAVIGEA